MKRLFLLACVIAGCSSPPAGIDTLGMRLKGETDPTVRLELVQRIRETGDHRMVPFLIDALQTVVDRGKLPDPDYTTNVIDQFTRGPELWGLIVTTGQDFKRDPAAWRQWWTTAGAKLRWDGSKFVPN